MFASPLASQNARLGHQQLFRHHMSSFIVFPGPTSCTKFHLRVHDCLCSSFYPAFCSITNESVLHPHGLSVHRSKFITLVRSAVNCICKAAARCAVTLLFRLITHSCLIPTSYAPFARGADPTQLDGEDPRRNKGRSVVRYAKQGPNTIKHTATGFALARTFLAAPCHILGRHQRQKPLGSSIDTSN